MRVLLVDDDRDFATLASTLLETESEVIEMSTETSPQAVLDTVDLDAVDCIVSDYRMPDMNGIEFLEAVRETHPRLPFILFTGKGSESVAQEAMAAGVSDYIVKDGSPEQYAISANRIENVVRQYRTQRRADRKRALDGLGQTIVRTVLTEPTREAIEQGVCDRLVDSGRYGVAWIGERDPHTGAVQPRGWAGDEGLRESVSFSTGDDPQSVEAGALTTGSQQVDTTLSADSDASQWAAAAADRGFRAALAVPISYEGIPYGVLGVYTERSGFSVDETRLLEMTANLTAFAIAASERRRGDTSRQVVDIEFDVSTTELPFVEIASALGCSVRLTQTLHQSNGTTLTRYSIGDSSPDRVDGLASLLDAESVQIFERTGTENELAVVTTESWWADLIGLHGARVGDATADAEGATLRIELPPTATVRSVVDLVCERYPGAKPIARRERNRSDRSLDDLRNLLGERLTDRQFEVIETAYHAGYYEWPHDVSSAETAELLGITQPTFAEHFWTAQRHIIDLLLETDADR
jgi:CheY-like chemotaxis protein